MTKNVIIDCDPGTDDSQAIIIALKSPEVNILGITVVAGNVPVELGSQNARRTLDLMGAPDIPVAEGARRPLVRDLARDPYSHGGDGQGENHLPASERKVDPRTGAQFIIDTVRQQEQPVYLAALGPMTNIALALMQAPDIAQKIARIYATSGNFGFSEYSQLYGTGDNPLSEWNVYVDPEATQLVFSSGIPITALGVDVWGNTEHGYTDENIAQLRASANPEAAFVAQITDYIDGRGYTRAASAIDQLTMSTLIDDSITTTINVGIGVETMNELTRGMTIVERRRHHAWADLPRIDAAISVDYEKFRQFAIARLLA